MMTLQDKDHKPAPPAAKDDEDFLDGLADSHARRLPARRPQAPPAPSNPFPVTTPAAAPPQPAPSASIADDPPQRRPVQPAPSMAEAPETEPPAESSAPDRPARRDVRLAVRAPKRNWPPPRQLAIHLAVIAAIIAVAIWLFTIWR